jgi:hypothetical protein
VFATTEGDLSDAQSVRLRERLAHDTECLGLYRVGIFSPCRSRELL